VIPLSGFHCTVLHCYGKNAKDRQKLFIGNRSKCVWCLVELQLLVKIRLCINRQSKKKSFLFEGVSESSIMSEGCLKCNPSCSVGGETKGKGKKCLVIKTNCQNEPIQKFGR
jgi:hypothetical protein